MLQYKGKLPETKCDKNTFRPIVDSIITGDFNEEFFLKKLKIIDALMYLLGRLKDVLGR